MNSVKRLPQELVDHIIQYYYADLWESPLLDGHPTAKGIEAAANFLRLRQVCRTFDAGVRDALPSLDEIYECASHMPSLANAILLFSLRNNLSPREHRLIAAVRRAIVMVCLKKNIDVAKSGGQHEEWNTECNSIERTSCLVAARLDDLSQKGALERNTEALETLAHAIAVGTAAHAGDVEVLRVLFNQREYRHVTENYILENAIFTAAREGQVDAVRFLRVHIPWRVDYLLDRGGNTALHCAVISGNLEMVDFFIHDMEAWIGTLNCDDMTPGMLAASLGNEAIAEHFAKYLSRDHYENLQSLPNRHVEEFYRRELSAMLGAAIAGGQMKVFELIARLMEGKKQNILVSMKRTQNPIWVAGLHGNLEAAKILMRRQLAGSKSASYELAWLGLIASAMAGHVETFEYFLWMDGIHTWIVRAEHRLLALAIANNHLDLVEYLIDCYPANKVFALIEGALYVAVHYEVDRIVSRLAKRRYSSSPVETDFTVTLAAAEAKFPEIVAFLDEQDWI